MIHSFFILHLTSSSRSRLQGFRLLSNEYDSFSKRRCNLKSAVSLSVENSEQDARRSQESTSYLQNKVSAFLYLGRVKESRSKRAEVKTQNGLQLILLFRSFPRSEFDKSRSLTLLSEIRERQVEGEIYRDQLEVSQRSRNRFLRES